MWQNCDKVQSPLGMTRVPGHAEWLRLKPRCAALCDPDVTKTCSKIENVGMLLSGQQKNIKIWNKS